jgi:iron complex outermembrane receptor protein
VRAANPGAALTTDPNGESATTDETTSFFQDLHLVGDIGERFNWLIGGEYLRLDSDSVLQTGRTPNAANGQSPGIVAPSAVKIRSRAVYGLAGYDITERLNVTAEARYTADERSIAVTRFDRRTGLPVTPARFTVNGVNEPTNFNYTLSAGLKLSPEWLVYGKLGTAFRAGNFNTDLGDPRGTPIPVAYNDEEATTYELGLKGNLTPPLFIAVTGYRTLTKDALVQKDNGCRAPTPSARSPRPTTWRTAANLRSTGANWNSAIAPKSLAVACA